MNVIKKCPECSCDVEGLHGCEDCQIWWGQKEFKREDYPKLYNCIKKHNDSLLGGISFGREDENGVEIGGQVR